MTAAERTSPPGRPLTRPLLLAGAGILGIGVAITILGVVIPFLFVPGTRVIGLGFLGLAAAGILGIRESRAGA